MRLILALSVLLLAVAGGCASRGPEPGAGSGDPQLPEEREFLSTAVRDGGKPRELASESPIRLTFDHGELRAQAGCNTLLGRARLDDGRLVVDDLGSTEMACEPPLMKQDKWLADFLGGKPRWQLDGENLTLSGGGTEIRLTDRRTAEPDRPLRGTRWNLDTLIDGSTASSLPRGASAWLEVSKDGRISGSSGCNTFGGKATVDGSRVRIGGLAVTRKACGGAKDEVERAVLAVLEADGLRYRIESGRLTLETPSGKALGLRAK